jgi:hypothetical protein
LFKKQTSLGYSATITLSTSSDFDRRAFLQGSTAITTAALLFASFGSRLVAAELLPSPVNPGQLSQDEFMHLSAFLTGYNDLKPDVGAKLFRAYVPGSAENRQLADLYGTIRNSGADSIDALVSSVGFRDAPVFSSAVGLISAWYLGFTGQGDQAQLATFEDALMFAPTVDVLPVPTYCRDETGAWAIPPLSAIQTESSEIQIRPPAK